MPEINSKKKVKSIIQLKRKNMRYYFGTFFLLILFFAGCGHNTSQKVDEERKIIAVSTIGPTHSWAEGVLYNAEMELQEVTKRNNWDYICLVGNNSNEQSEQVIELINENVDCIIMLPMDGASLKTAAKNVQDAGFQEIYDLWIPILDVFKENGIKFALEVHPGEIAFDYYSTQRLLKKFEGRDEFGLNFDPSHLIWQGVTPHIFLEDFIDKVYHVHMKDAAVTLDGRSGLLGSHINFGDLRRGWNFRSLGHGDVNFEEIIRVLNAYGYEGPLSVEWEDSGMERVYGATEAAAFVRKIDFAASNIRFDDAIKSS